MLAVIRSNIWQDDTQLSGVSALGSWMKAILWFVVNDMDSCFTVYGLMSPEKQGTLSSSNPHNRMWFRV